MANETLLTATGLLAAYPDNQAGLIDAVQGRDQIVSVTPQVGFIEDGETDTPYTMALADGVPTDFLAAYPGAPPFVGNFWKLNASNQMVPSYTDFGITVPAGTERLNDGSIFLVCEKSGNQDQDFIFQGTEGGQLVGQPVTRNITGDGPQLFAFNGVRLYDVSLAAPVSFTIESDGGDDLIIYDFRISIVGSML